MLVLSHSGRLLLRYLAYWRRATNAHGIHSPFVFALYNEVIGVRPAAPPALVAVEDLRGRLATDARPLVQTDLGAGMTRPARTVADVARRAALPPHWGRLLFRLASPYQPAVVFDLGTSLGISALTMAAGSPAARIVTFEGCPATAQVARENFAARHATTITLVEGDLDQTLAAQVAAVPRLDFVFFDANHRYDPTLRYFETCLTKAHPGSVFVLDDIHWSAEMARAWEAIKAHPRAVITADLFRFGLVFFRENQARQHFTLRF